VSLFDKLGVGDLFWLTKHVDIDVIWDGPLPPGLVVAPLDPADTREPQWRWEGYIASFSRSADGVSIQCKGALLQLDNWLAKPEYPQRPLPYEWAIARQFLDKPSLRLHPLRIIWPSWWSRVYATQKVPPYLMPAGVSKGENWTGLLTRSTGSWDPTLTSYIQSLLSSMYDERGRWTMDLDAHRLPVMFHRDFVTDPGPQVVTVDIAAPGVKATFNEDWEQSMTTVYGQGSSLSGVTYSGMNVSGDGSQTTYNPLAYLRQAYPEIDTNDWADRSVMVKEVMLQMQTGLSGDDAATVARAHLTRFSEPGLTGSVDLGSDPLFGDTVIPRHLVRAGMTLYFPGALGFPGGVIAHVTASRHNVATGMVNLTFDSKFRDALTSQEVRLRGRDAMSVTRMLIAGQYKPPVDDAMMPWSYAEGSGIIPSNTTYNATRFFADIPNNVQFPWTEWTTARPPKDTRWRSSYVHLGPAQTNANANWITQSQEAGTAMGVPIKVAEKATIRLLQVAAYDGDGNVLKVPFHIGFYYVNSVNVLSMPMIPAEQEAMFPPYKAGQRYPFVRDGFETYRIDGTKADPQVPQPVESAGLIRVYGTFYEKAGYWPGSYGEGDAATGLLVDTDQWGIDGTSLGDNYWNPYKIERNLTNPFAGRIYAMIYCDAQESQDVYFLGRMFRLEPTSAQSGGGS
jgi:hypothetical protein